MREVAKSMVTLSWAVSLFGAQQFAKLLTPSAAAASEATALEIDEVSRAVQRHLSEPVAQQFRAGDQWQRRVIDAMFDAAMLQSLDPRPIVRTSADLLQSSVDSIRQVGFATVTVQPNVPPVL